MSSPLIPKMRSLLAILALALCLGVAPQAFAQSDEPIPYDDGPSYTPAPSGPDVTAQPYSDPSPGARQETAVEQEDREVSLARFDDPAKGLGAELLGGMLLLDSSRGAGTDRHLGYGLRLTWDFGRLLSDDTLHEGLFADLVWLHTSTKEGTAAVFDSTSLHYFSLAPAFELPFGHGSPFGIYAQVGVGAALQTSTFTVNEGTTPVGGLKPLLQYGIGLRGRPLLGEEGRTRLAFRLELTRFRRGYMNDTYLGLSLGLAY